MRLGNLAKLLWIFGFCAFTGVANAQSIESVAAQYMKPVFDSSTLTAFNFSLPPEHSLADHETNSRLILLLSDLNIKRLDNQAVTEVKKHNVFFLQNTFSKGFINQSGQFLKYLVVQPKHPLIQSDMVVCPESSETLITHEYTTVCRSLAFPVEEDISPDDIRIEVDSKILSSNKKRHSVDIFVQNNKWLTWFYFTN